MTFNTDKNTDTKTTKATAEEIQVLKKSLAVENDFERSVAYNARSHRAVIQNYKEEQLKNALNRTKRKLRFFLEEKKYFESLQDSSEQNESKRLEKVCNMIIIAEAEIIKLNANLNYKSGNNLTFIDRQYIADMLLFCYKQARIAQLIGVHRSTISREIKRNSLGGHYNARKAHEMAIARRHVSGSYKKSPVGRNFNYYKVNVGRTAHCFIHWRSDNKPRSYGDYQKSHRLSYAAFFHDTFRVQIYKSARHKPFQPFMFDYGVKLLIQQLEEIKAEKAKKAAEELLEDTLNSSTEILTTQEEIAANKAIAELLDEVFHFEANECDLPLAMCRSS